MCRQPLGRFHPRALNPNIQVARLPSVRGIHNGPTVPRNGGGVRQTRLRSDPDGIRYPRPLVSGGNRESDDQTEQNDSDGGGPTKLSAPTYSRECGNDVADMAEAALGPELQATAD